MKLSYAAGPKFWAARMQCRKYGRQGRTSRLQRNNLNVLRCQYHKMMVDVRSVYSSCNISLGISRRVGNPTARPRRCRGLRSAAGTHLGSSVQPCMSHHPMHHTRPAAPPSLCCFASQCAHSSFLDEVAHRKSRIWAAVECFGGNCQESELMLALHICLPAFLSMRNPITTMRKIQTVHAVPLDVLTAQQERHMPF